MDNYVSVLNMQEIVFDKIEFDREGFKNDNELEYKLNIQIGINEDHIYKVTLILKGKKREEYNFLISLSGFFTIENMSDLQDELRTELIEKNAVAIMMPYLRSQVTLLTAQPGTESVVLPIFNINKMMK